MKVTVVGTVYEGLVSEVCLAELSHPGLCLDVGVRKLAVPRLADILIDLGCQNDLDLAVMRAAEAGHQPQKLGEEEKRERLTLGANAPLALQERKKSRQPDFKPLNKALFITMIFVGRSFLYLVLQLLHGPCRQGIGRAAR